MSDSQVHAIATHDGRLRVEFGRQQDRFAHRVLLDQIEVARSVEGEPDEPWPDSPPLQQLSLEDINGCETILAVGSAGRSHWSLSAQMEPDAKAANTIRFDVAVRCKDARKEDIRSTYLAAESVAIHPCEEASTEDRDIEARGKGAPSWRRVSIHPSDVPSDGGVQAERPTTVQWSYRILAGS